MAGHGQAVGAHRGLPHIAAPSESTRARLPKRVFRALSGPRVTGFRPFRCHAERTELPQAPVAEAAAVDGAAADGAAAAASGGAAGGAAAAAAVVFDPSAAGGAATRVTRVSTANAEEDFKAMVAQGGE